VLRAYRFWDSFEAGTNCKAWLLRILTNAFRNRYREWEREQEILGEAESCDAHLGHFRVRARATLKARSLAACSRVTWRMPLLTCCRVPPAGHPGRPGNLSYKEIADVMGCPAGTVMSRLYRGRRLLQKRLHDYAVESGIIRGQQGGSGAEVAGKAEAQVVDLDGFRRMKQEGG